MNRQSKIVILTLAIIVAVIVWYFYGKASFSLLGTLIQVDYYPPSMDPANIIVMTFNNKLPPQILNNNTLVFIYNFSNTHDIITTMLDSGEKLYGRNTSAPFMPHKISDYQLGTNMVPTIITEKYTSPVSLSGYGTIGFTVM